MTYRVSFGESLHTSARNTWTKSCTGSLVGSENNGNCTLNDLPGIQIYILCVGEYACIEMHVISNNVVAIPTIAPVDLIHHLLLNGTIVTLSLGLKVNPSVASS